MGQYVKNQWDNVKNCILRVEGKHQNQHLANIYCFLSGPGIHSSAKSPICLHVETSGVSSKIRISFWHRRRLLILAGGAETRNEKKLHTKNYIPLSVIKAQFGSLINNVLYPIH